jgi:hypothetical protein
MRALRSSPEWVRQERDSAKIAAAFSGYRDRAK